mgnify:CR=1 FL=1
MIKYSVLLGGGSLIPNPLFFKAAAAAAICVQKGE